MVSIDISRKYEDSSGNAMGRTRCNGDVLDVHSSGIYMKELLVGTLLTIWDNY